MSAHGWRIFDAETPVLTYRYSFGPGVANALAVGVGGGVVVVSPPCRVADGVFEDLARYGRVRALVASNAFHYLGLAEWKARFPQAPLFAPAQSIARIAHRAKLGDIRPLAEAAPIAGARVELIDMPHYRTGEVLVRAASARGLVWYVTDIVMNLRVLPPNPLVGLLFRLSGSGPGLRLNRLGSLVMVRDRAALKRWLAAEFDKSPPRWLIPAHGDIVDCEADGQALRRLFD